MGHGHDHRKAGNSEIRRCDDGAAKMDKGLFITTAKFSQGARDFANAQHIILVDGEKLTELMIEYDLGVSTQKTYQIKRIDSDYFLDD